MKFRITECGGEGGMTCLRVEGIVDCPAVKLLEQLCSGIRTTASREIRMDLSGVTYIDIEAGKKLKNLCSKYDLEFFGDSLLISEILKLGDTANSGLSASYNDPGKD